MCFHYALVHNSYMLSPHTEYILTYSALLHFILRNRQLQIRISRHFPHPSTTSQYQRQAGGTNLCQLSFSKYHLMLQEKQIFLKVGFEGGGGCIYLYRPSLVQKNGLKPSDSETVKHHQGMTHISPVHSWDFNNHKTNTLDAIFKGYYYIWLHNCQWKLRK